MSISNVPVPDELAAVREQIKRLEERETALKQILITDPSARTGTEWLVEVKTLSVARTDLKELRAAYPEQVDEHTHYVEQTRVILMGLTEDGEIVSARKLRSAAP